jgi:Ca2+-binding EF-hand superfamily protein
MLERGQYDGPAHDEARRYEGGFAMRIIFALMDPDGDGTISLEEFQAAHERIFKAMDADKDGTVSMEEMRDFFHGAGKATLPQRSAPKD